MTSTDDTARTAEVVRDLTLASTPPQSLEPGKIYGWLSPDGHVEQIDLTGDEHLDYPKYKTGTGRARDVAAFAQYYAKHADGDSEVFADLDAATITAVLDAHLNTASDQLDIIEGGARWQAHRVVLGMAKTPEWEAWTRQDRQLMRQADFAEFVEDHHADVAPDGPVTAAELLEMAQQFQAHTQVQFSAGTRLHDGQTQLTYTETTDAKAGNRGTIEIPSEFELALRPLEDCDPYRVKARFRYRVSRDSGILTMGYHLDNPVRTFRDAVNQVVAKTEAACAITVMRGRPA